jgi:predicted dehydrogenase
LPAVRVSALCDVNPKNLKRALDIAGEGATVGAGGMPSEAGERPVGFTNYRALLDAKDVDAVFIATPVHLHAPQALCALSAGKHVYLEKPLASNVDDCRKLLSAARTAEAAGQVFQVGFQRRYNPRYRRSIRFLHDGEAGRILFVRAQWHATGSSPKDKPWLFQREKSGDIVLEQACHQFDIFNWVFQAPPLRVCGFGGTRILHQQPGRDTMDHYGAVIEYAGGNKVHLSHLNFAIPDRRFSGIYELVFAERMGIDLANALVWTAAGETRHLTAENGNDTELAVEGFIQSVVTGKATEASAEAGYRATLSALLCQRALLTGQTAHWKELEPA